MNTLIDIVGILGICVIIFFSAFFICALIRDTCKAFKRLEDVEKRINQIAEALKIELEDEE